MRVPCSRFVGHTFSASVLILSIVTMGCSPETDQAAQREDAQSFSELMSVHADIVADMPAHPDTQALLDALLEAAIREKKVERANGAFELMLQQADSNVGLALLDRQIAALPGGDSSAKLTLLTSIEKRAPDSGIALKAFDMQLAAEAAESPESFLQKCADLLAQGPGEKRERLLLLRRWDHYRNTFDNGRAMLDGLRLAIGHSDSMQRSGLLGAVSGHMRDAGFVLESILIDDPALSRIAAKPILSHLAAAVEGADPAKAQAGALAYCTNTPDLSALMNSCPEKLTIPTDEVVFMARSMCLVTRRTPLPTIQAIVERSIAAAKEGIASQTSPGEEFAEAAIASAIACQYLLSALGFANTEPNAGYASGEIDGQIHLVLADSVQELSGLNMHYLIRLAQTNAGLENTDLMDKTLKRNIALLNAKADRRNVAQTYDDFVSAFPQCSRATQYLLELAKHYEEVWKVQVKAEETYRRLIAGYPDSPDVRIASLRLAGLLYGMEQFTQAYDVLQDLLTREDAADDMVPRARFMAALCESAMGLPEESRQHMVEITEAFPQNPIAARAFFWLGTDSLSRQEYKEASESFLELTEKYPASQYASQAKEYLKKLQALTSTS